MGRKVTFTCYNADRTRNASATPVLSSGTGKFINRVGTGRTAPSITNLGVGKFEFQFSDDDETVGTIALVATGCTPSHYLFVGTTPDKPFDAFVFFDGAGALNADAAKVPSIPTGGYQAFDGTALTPQALVKATDALYSLTPLDAELADGGVNYVVTAAAARYPDYDGDLIAAVVGSVIAPVVANFVPALPGPIQPTQGVQFDVTVSDGTPFANLAILIAFEGLETEEAAYDGADFSPLYVASSTVTGITHGLRFVLRRRGGWPANPIVKIRAVTTSGRLNS